jgi:CheY-like chemotaxis protein
MKRILLVDDDSLVRRAIRRVLMQSGLIVLDVPGATEALEPLQNQPFDCVLTDYHLPGRDGIWVLREARRAQPDAVRVLCSGGDLDPAHVASGLVNRFLSKPFDIDELLAACGIADDNRRHTA